MSKNILVISTSPRIHGNSDLLADAFVAGAEQAGNKAEKLSLAQMNIGFCKGCLACQKNGRCVISDDMTGILEKMLTADVIAFATPIYFYEMCGQMKTLLDRTNPLFPQKYAFRDIYLLASAADDDERAMDWAINGLQGWVDCFPQTRIAGVVRGTNLTNVGEAKEDESILSQAFQMGQST